MMQIFEEFKEYIITGIISAISAISAYIIGKRKSTAEVEIVETDVVKSIRELYGGLVEDIKSTVSDLKEAKKEVAMLSDEISTLRNTVRTLEKELEDCRKGTTFVKTKI